MTVTMKQDAYGKAVGETYTGPAESWLIAEGYAKLNGETGVDHLNQRAAMPADDPTRAVNREKPGETDMAATLPADRFKYRGDMEKAEAGFTVTPATGLAAGGTAVTLGGHGFLGTTGVTFGGVAATSVVVVDDETVTCVTGAHAVGAVNVVATDPDGSTTVTAGFTYTA